jgi:transposase InsO family protein
MLLTVLLNGFVTIDFAPGSPALVDLFAGIRILCIEGLKLLRNLYNHQLLTFASWARKREIKIVFIQPGNPQQNAYVERYNRTVRYDWLNQRIFDTIQKVQEQATKWLWSYNNERPNMANGGLTPLQKLAMAA